MHRNQKEAWDILATIYLNSSNIKNHKQKLFEESILVQGFSENFKEEQNWFKNKDWKQRELDQIEIGATSGYSKHDKIDQLKDQSSPKKNLEQEKFDQMSII